MLFSDVSIRREYAKRRMSVQLKLPFPELETRQGHRWDDLEENQKRQVVEKLAGLLEKAVTESEQEDTSDDGHK